MEDFDVGVSLLKGAPAGLAQELVEAFAASGARTRVEERESRPFASVEWLAPTAVLLYLAGPYVRTLMSEAAKDHYPTIKESLRSFVGRVSTLDVVRLTSGGAKLSTNPPGNLSVIVETDSGHRVSFIFPPAPELYEPALYSLFLILESDERRARLSMVLAGLLPDEVLGGRVVARFVGEDAGWILWDPIGDKEWKF